MDNKHTPQAHLIAELAQVRRQLADQEDYRTLVESTSQGIAVFQNGRLVFANSALVTISGYTLEALWSLATDEIFAMVHSKDRQRVITTIQQCIAERMFPLRQVFRLISRGGDTRWIEAEISTIQYRGEPALYVVCTDITGRVQAQSESKFRSVVQQLADGIVLTDEQGAVIEWNRSQEAITGIPAAEMLGQRIWDVQARLLPEAQRTPERLQAIKDIQQRALQTGELPRTGEMIEREYDHPDGTRHYLQGTIFTIRTSQGVMLASLTRDVTAQRQAENEAREQATWNQLLLDTIPDGYILADTDGQIRRVNSSYCALSGYTSEELTRMNIRDVEIQFSSEEIELHNAQIAQEGHTHFETTHRAKDGRHIELDISVTIVHNNDTPLVVAFVRDITAYKQTEAALRRQTEILETILDHIPVMIAFRDPHGHYQWVSQCYKQTLGVSPTDMQVFDLLTKFYPDPQYRQEVIGYIAAARGTWSDFKTQTLDGRVLDTSWVNVRLQDGSNIAIGIDITERKRAEEALREEKDRAQKYLDIAGVMFVALNLKGEVTLINQKGGEVLGYKPKEIVGKPWFDNFLPASTKDQVQAIFHRLMAGAVEPVEYYENPVLTKDGEERVIAWHNTILKDDKGKIIGTLSSGEDITERKRVAETLRESEEKFRTLTVSSPVGMFLDDAQGNAIYINEKCAELVGMPAEEVINLDWVPAIHPDDRKQVTTGWARAVKNGEEFHQEYRWVHADGEVVWTRGDIIPVRGGDGEVTLYIGTLADITNLKRMEMELPASLEIASRGQRMLLALSAAAQEVQRARTPEEVYHAIGKEIERLGYHSTVFNLSDDGQWLELAYITLLPDVLHAGERLVGGAAHGYRFRLNPGGCYDRLLHGGEVVFQALNIDVARESLPRLMRPLAQQLVTTLGIDRAIYAPLKIEGTAQSLLTIIGADLTEADVPAMAAFANQAAIAIENARLLQQVADVHERTQQLTHKIIQAQEDERRRIAQELHDELGQILTAVAFDLTIIENALPPDVASPVTTSLAEAKALIDQLDARTGELALDLRPSLLDDLGLGPALRWYVHRYVERTHIVVDLNMRDFDTRLAPEVETALYRVVQEALTNVSKHAGASTVGIQIARRASRVIVTIEDDGCGFAINGKSGPSTPERGLGLLGMQERVTVLGGTFNIQSQPGQGTRLVVKIPV